MRKPKVAIDTSIVSGGASGGVEQFIIGLVHGLQQINPEAEYILVTDPQDPIWLEPYLGDSDYIRIVSKHQGWRDQVKSVLRSVVDPLKQSVERMAKSIDGSHTGESGQVWQVRESNGFFNMIGADIVHFPHQHYESTSLPTVYNPHDLQHRHYPEYFDSDQLDNRDEVYRTGCESADAIPVASQWVKDDIIKQYGISPNKISVVQLSPPIAAYDRISGRVLDGIKKKYELPPEFMFYPAQTWPHKNHLGLIEALALVRDNTGEEVNLICTGKKNDHWEQIYSGIQELNLEDQVDFLGFVDPLDLRGLYKLSTFTIIPTLFEAASFPLFEAWKEGSPVVCSNATSLPEIAGDAALIFDPHSPETIADAIDTMSQDSNLRNSLRKRGKERVANFSWKKTAANYQSVYLNVNEQNQANGCTNIN
jgi:glycosyltransferase involved in cell wall biosynthesis